MIHIALCFDNNFVMQAGVTLLSIVRSNKHNEITFHLFVDNISHEDRENIKSLATDNCIVIFYDVNTNLLKDCPINPQIHSRSIAKYFRILIPTIIDDKIEKILYLDCDIIVVKDLSDFFKIDLGENAVGVVYDQKPFEIENFNRLKIDKETGYFNSGVIMINNKVWREKSYSKQLFELIEKEKSNLKWEDQDALNMMFSNNKLLYSLEYNLQNDMLYIDNKIYWKDREQLNQAINHPSIIHFCGNKPWNKSCKHPYKQLWLSYLYDTPWKNYHLKENSLKEKMAKGIKKLLMKHMTFKVLDEKFITISH